MAEKSIMTANGKFFGSDYPLFTDVCSLEGTGLI
jgi:hypothetical protein